MSIAVPSHVPLFAAVLLAVSLPARADIAPSEPETVAADDVAPAGDGIPLPFALGPLRVDRADGIVLTSETVPSVDGDVHLVTLRPWDATRDRALRTSFVTVTLYPTGLTLPGGSPASPADAVAYTLEHLRAAWAAGDVAEEGAATLPFHTGSLPATRVVLARDADEAEVTVAAVELPGGTAVVTRHRSNADALWFELLDHALRSVSIDPDELP